MRAVHHLSKESWPRLGGVFLTFDVCTLEERAEFRLVVFFLWIFFKPQTFQYWWSVIVGTEPRRLRLKSQKEKKTGMRSGVSVRMRGDGS